MCRSGSSCLFAAIQTSRIKAPHVEQIGRSTVRSGKEIVLKGAKEILGCTGRMPTRDAALTQRRCCLLDTENVYGDTQAALR